MAKPQAISIREAAQILGVSPATVRWEIRRERLPAFRVGRRLLIPRAAITELLACKRPNGRHGAEVST